jgi:microcystin degradation protein MlrC
VLRALLAARVEGACFACITDAETAAAAHAAGEGARIDVALGGHHGSLQGGPIHTTAQVRCITDGSWVAEGPIATGARFSLGPSALLSIDGVDVVVASRAEQTWDPAVFRLHGVDPEQRRIVVVKSSNHFRAAFEPMAAAVVTADAPGLTALDVTCLPRERHRLPLYPLDAAAVLAPSALQPSPPSSEGRG